MPAITSANLANAIVKLVAADALPALVGNLVMGNLVNRDYEPVLAQAGDTVNIPIAPTLVANNLVEGNAVQLQNPNVGNAQIVLNTHAEIPDLRVLGDRSCSRQRLRQPSHHQADRLFRERQIVRSHRRAPRLRHELRPEDIKILHLPDRSIDQRP